MKKTKIIIIFFLASFFAYAQKKTFTMEEAVLGSRSTLRVKSLGGIQFIPLSSDVTFSQSNNGQDALYIYSPSSGEKKVLVSAEDINSLLKTKNLRGQFRLGMHKWVNNNEFTLPMDDKIITIDPRKKVITKVEQNSGLALENADECSVNGLIAYTVFNNLFVLDGEKTEAVSNENNQNIVFGSSGVHRNEFGISKGTFWSPTGNYLAFYRMDQQMVNDYPVINWSENPAKENIIKYPMAGGTSHQVTLGVYSVKNKSTIYLKTEGPDDHYLTNISWSPDEKYIFIAELNRDQSYMKLNQYDASSGSFIKTLFEEKDEKYVEPLNPMLFVNGNPNQFIWQSRRDGYNHLYLYDITGKLIKQLTKGNWEVLNLNGFDSKAERLFFHANINSPVTKDFCSVNLKTAKIDVLTQGAGLHNCQVDSKGENFVDEFTNITTPRKISVINIKSKKSSELINSDNPLTAYELGKVNIFTIKNKSGTDLWCRMYLPINFDSTKKYPVVVYLYGGPHHQEVLNTFNGSNNLWYQYMAQRGFIVFTLDNRGSEHRGKEFEQATFRNLGTQEMEDQVDGVNYLKSLKYVDADRMGVHGWSFGGFMTTSLMTRKPGTFKVGVGGGPVIDWSMYEVMYTERYMDTPQSNGEGFRKSSLFQYIPNLKGKLLLIHGTDDDVVVWQHSLKYLKSCVDQNVQLDYFVYPGHPHNVSGKDRVHLMQKITDYFIQNL
ncbi:MAG: DPP IV N-terminal domain-containing protein [Bacteroidota bacterium]|jgi:dipeptidyl-peptidase-4